MNKNAKTSPLLIIGGVLLLLILGYGVYTLANPSQIKVELPSTPGAGTGCSQNPTIVAPTGTDFYVPGTAITALTSYYVKNGVYTGTSVPTVIAGDKVKILTGNNSVVDAIVPEYSAICGNNPKEIALKTYANASISIYNTAGTGVMTNNLTAAPVINETQMSVGGNYNWRIHMVGTDKKSTGKILVIMETSEIANVSGASLSGATEQPIPNGYARQINNGFVKVWEVPALDGNTFADYNLGLNAQTAKLIKGTTYFTFYAEQPFIDTDGSIKETGAFDGLNTAKWQDRYIYNVVAS